MGPNPPPPGRTPRGRHTEATAAVLAGLALLLALPGDTVPRLDPRPAARAEAPFGAECRLRTEGPHTVADCHNPYPETDRLRLHLECARWWDVDSDGAAVAAGPARTVRLDGRCWKEVRAAWVGHQR
ncbi:hypothetical protein [Streptomyces physcomitrii]|uniref:hypothetical protein n=1 Tax=Streptomyces physcomitrii TaxID=2724184 RepID=UPI0035E4629E